MKGQFLRHAAIVGSILGLLLVSLAAQAEINSLASAINKAGRQRMLTQSMVKDYCLIGQDINKEGAVGRLEQAVALFDSQLKELKAFAPTDETHDALIRVENKWLAFKPIVLAPASRDKLPALVAAEEELLAASHKAVLLFQDVSGSSAGRLVNISGRQRMLSQRLAMLYLLRTWGYNNSQVTFDTEQARNEFKGALSELEGASENNNEVSNALADARRQWNLFEYGLNRDKELIPLIVAMSSDKLVATMNEITGMYEKIAIRNLGNKTQKTL